jgi:hypothetical protein
MRTSGQNEVIHENLEVDIWSQDWMYSPKCGRRLYFSKSSESSCFLILGLF